jgi:hypothetical protein
MRVLLVIFLSLFTLGLQANEDKEMKELFHKYDKIMKHHRVELVEEVFTQKFLKENGGKEEFIAKVKELPKLKERKGLRSLLRSWKKSKVGKIFFAKVKDEDSDKEKSPSPESQFIVVEEDGKLKIDGTVSDGE